MEVAGARVAYLDEVPPRTRLDAGSAAPGPGPIHDFLYGDCLRRRPPDRHVPARAGPRAEVPTARCSLTKCCLFEDRVEIDGRTVVTPWGASFGELREGLAVGGVARARPAERS